MVSFTIGGTVMFSLKEKVVYPGHGVAEISCIVEKKIGGKTTSFFELKFLNKDMTILVPTQNLSAVGIRRLSSPDAVDNIFKMLSEPVETGSDAIVSKWNKRNKEYQSKLRTGKLDEICEIYRYLNHVSVQKELSFGEKNLLGQTESLLVEEISLVSEIAKDITVQQLRSLIQSNSQKSVMNT